MLITILVVSIALLWLAIESRWLTVHLPVGNHTKPLANYFDADFDEVVSEQPIDDFKYGYPNDWQEFINGLC